MFALVFSFGAFFLSIIVGKKSPYAEKNSTYECGFEPFDETRGKFEVKFYLVAILFIIFSRSSKGCSLENSKILCTEFDLRYRTRFFPIKPFDPVTKIFILD